MLHHSPKSRSSRKRSSLNKIHAAQVIEVENLETNSKKQKTETITSVAQTQIPVVFATASNLVQQPKTIENFVGPNSIESLRTKTHDEIMTLFIGADVLKEAHFHKIKLDGSHLYNAIQAYEDNLQSGGTIETAKEKMLAYLLRNEKVTDEEVALSIVHWLHKNYVGKQLVSQNLIQKSKTLENFFEQILQVDLNLENRDIETVIENSSKRLIYSFGYDFHFVGRTTSIQQIETCFIKYVEKITRNHEIDRQSFSIPFIAAAPGIGKSKLLKHCAHLQWKKGLFPLFVSFGNGTSRGVEETNIESALSLRMIYSIYCGLLDEDQRAGFGIFLDRWHNYFESEVVDIASTLYFINTILHQLYAKKFGNTKLQFFIAIDEIHQIDDVSNSNLLRELLRKVGRYMQHPQHILLPLFAGTYYTVIKSNFIGSTYKPEFIPLKAFLSPDEQIELINALALKENENGEKIYKKLTNWRTNINFRHYLRTFGGFPRGIEYFLEDFLEDSSNSTLSSWTLANTRLSKVYPMQISISFSNAIMKKAFAQQVICKNSPIVTNDQTSWSDLESQGVVMLQSISDSDALIYYPPILLDELLGNLKNDQLLTFFRQIFLHNSQIFWQNWETIVHIYVYFIFSILGGEENIKLNQLFPFAKMSLRTSSTIIPKINSNTLILESATRIYGKISEIQYLTVLLAHFDNIVKDAKQIDLSQQQVFVVKNGNGASAGDILVFGLESEEKEKLVFHYQCKWSDQQNGLVYYSQIEKEMKKNQELYIGNSKKNRNITIIMCGTMISGLPETLPDDLIIIYKENFNQFFGMLSDTMKSACAQQYIRINELNVRELQSFSGIGEVTAKGIIEKRGKEGFLNLEDLQSKLDTNSFKFLLHGGISKNDISNDNARTILF